MTEIIAEFLWGIVVNLVLLPICLVLATPCILLGAAFGLGTYWGNVQQGYKAVIRFWKSWPWWIP